MKILVLLLALLGSAHAASNVRLMEIDPFANTVIIKNYGDTTEIIHPWSLSSRGTTIGLTGDPRITVASGTTTLAAGAEVKLKILNTPDFLSRKSDDLALDSPTSIIDYIVWGSSGGFGESTAATAGIWALGDRVELGEKLTYTGDGSDTEPRVNYWTPKQTNLRLLSVDPVANRFTIKNFDTTAVDIREWLFTISGFSLSLATSANISSPTGVTVLDAGDELTLHLITVILNPAGNALGMYRSESAGPVEGGIVDFVQWIITDNSREPVANAAGIWSVDATLEVAPIYTYDGNGNDTGPRESYWNGGGGIPPAEPISATFTFNASDQPELEFTTVDGRQYEIQHSADLATWTPVSPTISGTGASATWADTGAAGVVRRFYQVIDVTSN